MRNIFLTILSLATSLQAKPHSIALLEKRLESLTKRYEALQEQLNQEDRTCYIIPSVCQGRLTLTTAKPYSEPSGVGTLYFTPYNGNQIALYDGTCWVMYQFSEVSYSGAALNANSMYDIFAYASGGAVALELLQWTNSTTRVALGTQNGVYVRGSDSTRRFIGTVKTSSGTSFYQNASWQLLSNACNPKCIKVYRSQTAGPWSNSATTWTTSNIASSYTTHVYSLAGTFMNLKYMGIASATAAPYGATSGIGLTAGTNSSLLFGGQTNTTNTVQISSEYVGVTSTAAANNGVMMDSTDGNSVVFNFTASSYVTGMTGFICGR